MEAGELHVLYIQNRSPFGSQEYDEDFEDDEEGESAKKSSPKNAAAPGAQLASKSHTKTTPKISIEKVK